jgi:hypothetical protein
MRGDLGGFFVFEFFEEVGGGLGVEARQDFVLVVAGQVGEGFGAVGGVQGRQRGDGGVYFSGFERGADLVKREVNLGLFHACLLNKNAPRGQMAGEARR